MSRPGYLAALLALAACGGSPSTQVAERRHVAVMSLNPCIDAILVRVADPQQIISISHYSQDARATSIPLKVAQRYKVNYETAEEVIALRPSIVLLGSHVAPATEHAIASVGVQVVRIGVPSTIAESRDQIMAVARAVGHEERGRTLVAQIDSALAHAAPRPGARPVMALIRMGGGLVPGQGTLVDELLERTGFQNSSRSYGLGMWDILPLERMIARPPEILLAQGFGTAALAHFPHMRVAEFPDHLLQCAGPNLIEAAQLLGRIRQGTGR